MKRGKPPILIKIKHEVMESSFRRSRGRKGWEARTGAPQASLGSRSSQTPNSVCPLRVRSPRSCRRSSRSAGAAGRRLGTPALPPSRPGRAAPGSAAAPGPAPPDRYRPHLPRLCLGVSPPASWQRSLRHWKSNRNPAASLLLRSLAIARSLPRQLSGVRGARRSSFGVGKSGGGGGE